MKFKFALAALLAATAIPASAATITYTYTSTFTGTNNGGAFTIGATFTAVGDTNVTQDYFGFPAITLTSFTAAADGPYIISTPFVFGYNTAGGVAGFVDPSSTTNGFTFSSPGLIGYDGKSNISVATTPNYTVASFTTDRGNIVLTEQTAGTFSAVVSAAAVPEPATWGMMILGFGMVGYGLRRRKASVRTSVRFA